MPNNIVEITDDNFTQTINNTKELLIIIFTAPWCEPCKAFKKDLISNIDRYDGIAFGFIDVSENNIVVNTFDVKTVPTVFFIKNSTTAYSITDNISCSKIDKIIDDFNLTRKDE